MLCHGCGGNYNEKKKMKMGTEKEGNKKRKQKVFRLPRNKDEKEEWISIIPRDNIPLSKHTVVVCERNWPPGYAKKQDYGKNDLCPSTICFYMCDIKLGSNSSCIKMTY